MSAGVVGGYWQMYSVVDKDARVHIPMQDRVGDGLKYQVNYTNNNNNNNNNYNNNNNHDQVKKENSDQGGP